MSFLIEICWGWVLSIADWDRPKIFSSFRRFIFLVELKEKELGGEIISSVPILPGSARDLVRFLVKYLRIIRCYHPLVSNNTNLGIFIITTGSLCPSLPQSQLIIAHKVIFGFQIEQLKCFLVFQQIYDPIEICFLSSKHLDKVKQRDQSVM